jgi:ADP-heptose:LPS heptosyltransferase
VRILVLQLCRMGDLLQTTPMLRGLRREHPDAEITLVVHDMFRDVPIPSRLYDHKIAFPYTKIAAGVSDAPEDWAVHASIVRDFVSSLGAAPFDAIINLTHSDLCGLLSTLIPSRRIEGGIVSRERVRLVQGPWMSWFWASQTSRAQGCFNLVDLHNWTAGVASDRQSLEIEVSETARARVQEWLAARGAADRPLIAVQLGASEERKRWQPERFAAAVDLLPPALGDIVFVGAPSERSLVERARAARPFHDAVGETSMPELAALLERCRLLLTNDTGTMHIASAVGTKIVDVSTGPVFVHETGPYGEGHFVIEPEMACFPCTAGSVCHHISCRESFTPADIAALVAHALGEGPLPRPAGARISTGTFTSSGRIAYRTLWTPGSNRTEAIRHASAEMWEETMPVPRLVGCAASLQAGAHARLKPGSTSAGRAALTVLSDFSAEHAALQRLASHATGAAALARRIPRAPNAERETLSQRINETLQAIRLLGHTDPICQPIAAYLLVRLEGVLACDVGAVAQAYVSECSDASRRAGRLSELLGAERNESAA